eukprot:6210649-Pleurochrysis_carterae.AAC.8
MLAELAKERMRSRPGVTASCCHKTRSIEQTVLLMDSGMNMSVHKNSQTSTGMQGTSGNGLIAPNEEAAPIGIG